MVSTREGGACLDILVGIVAARVGRFFDGLDALGIDYGRCRLGVLACPLPLSSVQDFEDEGPQPVQSESSEMVVNGRPWRKVVGQKPPSTAAFEHVEDSVENIAQGVGPWSFSGFRGG